MLLENIRRDSNNCVCMCMIFDSKNIMEFWLDRGVDGFRFSAVAKLYENKDFPDEPPSVGRESWPAYYSLYHIHTSDRPENVDTIIEWRRFLDDYSRRKNSFTR